MITPQLSRGINLDLDLESKAKAEVNGYIDAILNIIPNNLKKKIRIFDEEIDSEKDTKEVIKQLQLENWPEGICSDSKDNVISFLKGKYIPKPLKTRIDKIPKHNEAYAENFTGKLKIQEGNNRYSYNDHIVYLNEAAIGDAKKENYDAVIHELDHAFRVRIPQPREKTAEKQDPRFQQAYDKVKAEVFALHAQMLSIISSRVIGKDRLNRTTYLKGLGSYIYQYSYDHKNENMQQAFNRFIKQLFNESSEGIVNFLKIYRFLELVKSRPGTFIPYDEVENNIALIPSLNHCQTIAQNYIKL